MKNTLKLIFATTLALYLTACGAFWDNAKPYVQTVDDVAKSMCANYYGETMKISVDDAFKMYCRSRDAFSPWIDPAIASMQAGAAAKQSQAMQAGQGAPECAPPEPAASTAPPAPEAPPAPAQSAAPAPEGG